MKTRFWLIVFNFLILVHGVSGQDNFRIFPYLQVNQNQVQIRWFSSQNYTSSIVLKDAQGNQLLSNQVSGLEVPNLYYTQAEKNQVIAGLEGVNWIGGENYFKYEKIYNLPPNQTFIYSVTLNGETFTSTIQTAPDSKDWESIRFIALSDSETEPLGRVNRRGWYPGNPLIRFFPVPAAWKSTFGVTLEEGFEIPNYLLTEKDGFAENLKILKSRNPDFVLMPGDLVQGGAYMPGWDEFWRHTAGEFDRVFDKIPLIPAIGNWESFGAVNGGYGFNERGAFNPVLGRSRFHSFFEFPTSDLDQKHRQSYYRTDYGPITILTLDSSNGTPEQERSDYSEEEKLKGTALTDIGTDTQENYTQAEYQAANGTDLSGFGPGSPQYEWLEKNLIKAKQEGRLIFVQFHHIPYSSGENGVPMNHELATGQEGIPLRILHPLFEEYGVIAVFAGHDELFERSFVDEDADGKGVHYYDVGVAGDGMRGVKRDWLNNPLQTLNYNTFSKWTADQNSVEQWDNSGTNPVLLDGGKHYGHLEVNLKKIQDGDKTYAQIDFEPVYAFPVMNNQYQLQRIERRVYNDPLRILVELSESEDPVIEPDFKSSLQVALNSEGFIITSLTDYFNSPLQNDWNVSLSRGEIYSCADLGIQKVTVTVKNSLDQEWTQEVSVEVIDNLAPDFEATDAYLAFDKTVGVLNLSPIDFYIQEQFIFENCKGAGGLTVELDKTIISCADPISEPIPVQITITDKSGNSTTKTRKVFLNPIESKKVSLKASGNLVYGNSVTLTLGDELEYEVAFWKRIGSSGLETFPDSTSKTILVDEPGQYVAVLNLSTGCQVESEWIVVEQTSTDWPQIKENLILSLNTNGIAELNSSSVFDPWPVEGVSVSFSKTEFSCGNLGKNQVSATLSHPIWGQKEISFEVSIVDELAPILTLKTPQLDLDRIKGFLEVEVQDFIFSVTDNCEVSSFEISPSRITCEQIGKEVVFEINAKDPAGNQTQKQISVTIGEIQSKSISIDAVTPSPYFTGEAVELRLGNEFEFAVEGWYQNGQLLTGQKGNSILVEQSGAYYARVIPVGGCVVETEVIEVTFDDRPYGSLNPIVNLNLTSTGQAILEPSMVFTTWPQNDTSLTILLSQTDFSCEDIGDKEVTVTIKNQTGQTWTEKIVVRVQDKEPPVLVVKDYEFDYDVQMGTMEIEVENFIVFLTDNCAFSEVRYSKTSVTCEDVGKEFQVGIEAIDAFGNKTETTAKLTVRRVENQQVTITGSTQFCQGDEGLLTLNSTADFEVIRWRRNGTEIPGQTSKTLTVTESGTYHALIRYTGACLSESNTFEVTALPIPSGEIQVDGNILRAPEGFIYQWYRNGDLMPEKTDRTLIVDSMGEYKVSLENEFGCIAMLNPVTLTISGIAVPWTSQAFELKIYPNPAKQFTTLELREDIISEPKWLKIFSTSGQEVTSMFEITSLGEGKFGLQFSEITSGTYLLTWIEPGKKAHFGRLIISK